VDAKAKVKLATANVAKAQVFVDYTKIVSPYDGVVTKRTFHVGDFIRAADQGGNQPLLTVARTDLMRVIVQVPERDVPYTNVGDPAIIELAALGGTKLQAKVSRIANSEDRATRTMRTEIDVPNSSNRLRDGMFGKVTIIVDEGKGGLTVPSSSLVSNPKTKKDSVFVVRDGKARLTPVEVGQDNGPRTEIESGLSADDRVIVFPPADLADGAAVEVDRPGNGRSRPE
jgi:RND family efflux transporter MFP subunit